MVTQKHLPQQLEIQMISNIFAKMDHENQLQDHHAHGHNGHGKVT